MLISNYYRGSTELVSGFIYDTEKRTYKTFQLKAKEWSHTWRKGNYIKSGPLKDFKNPADITYYFPSKSEMEMKLIDIQKLGFTEDNSIVLDFGTVKK